MKEILRLWKTFFKDELQKKEKYELALKKYNEFIERHEVRNYMNQIQILHEKGRVIRSDKSNYKRGLFSFFNKKPELNNEAQAYIERIHLEIRKIYDEIEREIGIVKKPDPSFDNHRISFFENALTRYREFLNKKIEKEHKLEIIKGLAATATGESRKIAEQIKPNLGKNELCPYCDNPLGKDVHADHIYPLSKGGLSVTRNMVYICASCNLKKRDLTITQFIKKYNLDREKIEKNLELLKKDY